MVARETTTTCPPEIAQQAILILHELSSSCLNFAWKILWAPWLCRCAYQALASGRRYTLLGRQLVLEGEHWSRLSRSVGEEGECVRHRGVLNMARASQTPDKQNSFIAAAALVQTGVAMIDRAQCLAQAGAARESEGDGILRKGWRLMDAGENNLDEARRVMMERDGAATPVETWTEQWVSATTAPMDEDV